MDNPLSKEVLLAMYRKMVQIRQFEERIRFLFLEGIMPGTIHQYQGQEACAVGVCSVLAEGDVVTSTHRPHGHALARGLTTKEMMAELFGKTTGCCRGKGGSMHMGNLEKGMLPAIAIVGGGLPIANGIALHFKMKKKQNVAVGFFGDGASNEGSFHETLNLASIWKLPIVFVCENNLYGASTHVNKVMNIKNIADRADAYGIPGDIADGMDVVNVYTKANVAVERARNGEGPTLLELKTYRFVGHSRRDPNNYRPDEEEAEWLKRDPIGLLGEYLKEYDFATDEKLSKIDEDVKREIDEAVAFAQSSADPAPEDALKDVFA